MKKILVSLFAFVALFTSCMDKEEIDIEYEAKLQVTAENLFKSFHEVKEGDFNLNGKYGNWNLNLHTFIYDEQNKLILKKEKECASLNEMLEFDLNLAPGKYMAVSIADFTGSYNGTNYDFWKISEGTKLEDLSIVENDGILPSVFETLGLTKTAFSVGEASELVKVDIKPITSLIEMFIWEQDLVGTGKNGFSSMVPYLENVSIWAPTLKQEVRYQNDGFIFNYGKQDVTYKMFFDSPKDRILTSKSTEIFGYRAVLPDVDRFFYWSVQFMPGYGEMFGLSADYQESDYTSKISFEPGKQYVMDLLLDGLYLFVDAYDPSVTMFQRAEKYIQILNKQAFDKIMDREYEYLIGSTSSFIESQFGKPILVDGNLAYYLAPMPYLDMLVVGYDKAQKVSQISLKFMASKIDFSPMVIDYLNKRFTVFEKGTSAEQKAYINAKFVADATVGIIWTPKFNSLVYVSIKH